MGLQHFHDNDAGGSQHGDVRGGLTAWGAELIERLEERGWVVDLAHSSVDVIRDVLKMATKCEKKSLRYESSHLSSFCALNQISAVPSAAAQALAVAGRTCDERVREK